jgi:hypothetical protein
VENLDARQKATDAFNTVAALWRATARRAKPCYVQALGDHVSMSTLQRISRGFERLALFLAAIPLALGKAILPVV